MKVIKGKSSTYQAGALCFSLVSQSSVPGSYLYVGWNSTDLATNSIFFCLLFVKTHWFAWGLPMWFYLKLGFRAFFGISRKNWDFRQNIWISGARGRPEIHKNARNPNFLPNPNIWKTTWEGPRRVDFHLLRLLCQGEGNKGICKTSRSASQMRKERLWLVGLPSDMTRHVKGMSLLRNFAS